MDPKEKRKLVVTAMASLQIYAQCHDQCLSLGVFKHDLKMFSKNLISKIEREFMPLFEMLGNIQDGNPYLKTTEIIEQTLQNLATLPVEYWPIINKGVSDVKNQIQEKNTTQPECQTTT